MNKRNNDWVFLAMMAATVVAFAMIGKVSPQLLQQMLSDGQWKEFECEDCRATNGLKYHARKGRAVLLCEKCGCKVA